MTSNSNTGISSIIVAGSGFEAWLTAATLLKNLGRANTRITVCPVEDSDALDGLYSLMPDIDNDALHSLGITNLDLVKTCQASFSMGTRYTGLSPTDFDQFKPYGSVGIDFLGGAFVHHWLRNTRETEKRLTATDYFSYSQAYEAARKNSFAPPVKRSAIGPLQYQIARHVDVRLLTEQLRDLALSNGVMESTGSLKSVERSRQSSYIDHLLSNNDEVLKADLYVDCSGKKNSLLAETPSVEWVPVPLSPAYELRFKNETTDVAPPPFNLASSLSSGWQVTIPGYGWQLTLDLMSESGSSTGLAFRPGYLSKPWSENRVAMGVASTQILPIGGLQYKFLMAGLKRLLKLLPGSDCAAAETMEFNHLSVEDAREVAELSALYEIARQQGSIELSKLASLDIPESLRKRLALYFKRGWVASLDTDLIDRSDWSNTFILLGLFPNQHDRVVERIPADKLRQSLHDLKERIAKVVAEFPPHGVYLDAMRSSPERKGSNG